MSKVHGRCINNSSCIKIQEGAIGTCTFRRVQFPLVILALTLPYSTYFNVVVIFIFLLPYVSLLFIDRFDP